MELNFLKSIIYVLGAGSMFLGVLFYKKNDKTEPLISWIVIDLLLVGCFQCFAAGVFDLVHIPVGLISIAIVDALASGYFWFAIKKSKSRQNYEYKWLDTVFLAVVAVIIIYICHSRYDGLALNLRYMTIDPVNHFRVAMDVLNGGTVASMYYEGVWNAMFIGVFAPLTTVDYYYKIFVVSELTNLALSAGIIYALVRKCTNNRFNRVAAIVISGLYMVGYPLCSMMYGFVYLGMGLTLIGLIAVLTEVFVNEEMPKWLGIIALMLACNGIFECYVMFMPIVFFAVISCIFLKQFKNKKLISKDTIVTCLAVFLLPCIFGFIFTYLPIFMQETTVSNAIANEGANYKDLYSNFVPFLPFAIIGYIQIVKNKKNRLMLFLTPYSVIFTLVLFVKAIRGSVSTYYYYKMYFLLWLVAFVLVFYCMEFVTREGRKIIGSCFAVYMIIMVAMISCAETKIANKCPGLITTNKASSYTDIFATNYFNLKYDHLVNRNDKMELYHWVYNFVEETGEFVPMAGGWEDDLWFQDVTNQRYYGWGQSNPDHTDYFNHLNDSDAKYVLVLLDSQIYRDNTEYFDSLDVIYETWIGKVVKL